MKSKSKKNNKKTNNKKNLIILIILAVLLLVSIAFNIYFLTKDCDDEGKDLPNQYQYTEKKPVLYLYPKKNKTKVTVKFDNPELLTTTYPLYKDKWVVTADKNGDLYDKKGNFYYSLYWEETKHNSVDWSKGYYVTKENAISFLEDKLKYIGLNEKERNEFIIYWLPVLENNGKSIVHFELTDERQSFNKITVTPKPDSMLRMSMHIKKVDKEPKNIEMQHMKHFNRKGFAVVEWGGVIHDIDEE